MFCLLFFHVFLNLDGFVFLYLVEVTIAVAVPLGVCRTSSTSHVSVGTFSYAFHSGVITF